MIASTAPEGAVEPDLAPTISIIIVNWNARSLLHRCLQSLAALQDDVTFEVLVVDNASRDGSVDFVTRRWPNVQAVALPENLGFGAANNIGFRLARGDYLLVLNPDTEALPGMLSSLLEVLRSDPDIGCVGARHFNPDMSLQWSIDDFPTVLNDALHYTDLNRLRPLQGWLRRTYPRFSEHLEERDVDWVNGACMLVPRRVVEATGGFDEYFFLFHEELDWCKQIWDAGYRVRFVPSAGLVHVLGGTFSDHDGQRLALVYQSSLRYYLKNKPRWQFAVMHTLFVVNALTRIALITAMTAWEGVTRQAFAPSTWTVVTQHPSRLSVAANLRMWWSILTVRAHTRIRPTDHGRPEPADAGG